MLQGTASHVGKSVLTAALCRVFREAGRDVAPFKAQNMALNAYVTRDGGEIGWAQAVQAEAALVEPAVEMNPILLKPQSGGAQVIVLGKVWATLSARDYYGRRVELWDAVVAAYEWLADRHDLLLIEGAGSPAEPNLMDVDIANMAVARLARAPVLLIGDIDRGGVFAHLLGSLALLRRADRRRVRGFILNKFRGDRTLLTPALDALARRTRRPVLGVVPYVADLRLPEEDSVALDSRERARGPRPVVAPVVAVVHLPHIANFTDFEPLDAEPALDLRYVRHPEELAGATLVLLPGSKDTLADLRWLHASGFAAGLRAHVAAGGRLGGICGGFQMLGRAVEDPEGLEGGGRAEGLACLPITTVLERGKVTRRVRARLPGRDEPFEAYEIHVGRTSAETPVAPLAVVEEETGVRPEGAMSADGRVWGTYLHGLFDAGSVRAALLGGLEPATSPSIGTPSYRALRELEYARLAAHVRASLDLGAVEALIRGGR
jgi:adenosylcobyric acid synthase